MEETYAKNADALLVSGKEQLRRELASILAKARHRVQDHFTWHKDSLTTLGVQDEQLMETSSCVDFGSYVYPWESDALRPTYRPHVGLEDDVNYWPRPRSPDYGQYDSYHDGSDEDR